MPSFCLRLLAAVLAAYRNRCSTGSPTRPSKSTSIAAHGTSVGGIKHATWIETWVIGDHSG
jgi:hypothetical protein